MSKSIDRRGALKRATFALGGLAAAPALLSVLQSCEQAKEALNWTPAFFDDHQARMLSSIAEHIIPKTDTPGALDAGVHIFIDSYINACVPDNLKNIIPDGLKRVDEVAKEKHQDEFLATSAEQQIEVLTAIAEEDYDKTNTPQRTSEGMEIPNFFKAMKELTLLGYFTSEKGAKEALALLEIPGDYIPCADLEEGQKSWAIEG